MPSRGPRSPLERIDLNLLVALDALLAERNVTHAARRLGKSQPALSAQLKKLREALGDPLLLAGPRGMTPTALGASLEGPLRAALAALTEVIAPARTFDPTTTETTWRIGASDYGGRAIVEPLLGALRERAPRSRLALLPISHAGLASQVEDDALDLALVTLEAAPPRLRHRKLFTERYVLVGRSGHPALRKRPSLTALERLEFAIVSPDGAGFRSPVDVALEARGRARKVVLSVPQFMFLLSAVASSDIVAFLPARIVPAATGLRVVEPPLEIPGFDMAMVWHDRVHRDPAQAWLRERVVASTAR